MAVNTALALVDGGKNRVCLVDLDLAFGDVAITLQLFPSRTLADAIAMEAGLDFISLETLLTQHKDGLYLLAAPVQPDARDSITPSLVGKVLRLLKANFDYVVVDTAPSFDEHVLQAIDETDELLLVTTLDVPTLKNVKIAAETLDLLNFPKPQRRLVLNRADEKVGLEPEKVASTLAMAIAAAIPNSPQVPNQTNAGEPIVAAQPRHPVSRAITALAFEIQGLGDRHVDQDSKPARNGSPRRTLLRRNAR
jgi:pilus assembly protein CpaE